MRPALRTLAPLVALLAACTDSTPPPADETGGSTTDAATDGGTTLPMTGSAESGSGDASTDGAESSTGSVDGSTGSDDATTGDLEVEVEVVTYEAQPMVVDLAFSEPGLDATLEHDSDPGVRFAVIDPPDDRTWVRVRGLRPATEHTVGWLVSDGGGDAAAGEVVFTTENELPGFQPEFAVTDDGGIYEDYVLFDLVNFGLQTPSSIFMVDPSGTPRWHLGVLDDVVGIPIVHAAATLRDDGSVLYLRDDTIRVVDELSEIVVEITDEALGVPGMHHEVLELPNGNFLTLSYSFATVNYPGPGTTLIAGDVILEVTPEAAIVWEWDTLDHLDPLRTRDGFEVIIVNPDTGEDAADWTHGNGLVYDEATDTVLLSMRHQDWVIAIDRATDEVLWRLGEDGDFTLQSGTWQFHQHSPQWQADGTLLLYDNGVGNPGLDDALERSRAVRYSIDVAMGTADQVWEETGWPDFVSAIAGDANRQPDDTILVLDSAVEGPASPYVRIRRIDESPSFPARWELQTDPAQLIYRVQTHGRLVGEPAPR